MRYQIIEASSKSELEESVQREIEAGWKPQGGVAAYVWGEMARECFYQSMIKEAEQAG